MQGIKQLGLSLVETLLTTLILAIIAFAANHSMVKLVDRHRVSAFATELRQLTYLARFQALAGSKRITLCPLSESGDCTNEWNATLSVFRDPDNRRKLHSDHDLLKVLDVPPAVRLEWQGMGGGKALHFNGKGLTSVTNGTFRITSRETGEHRRIIINRQGRARVER